MGIVQAFVRMITGLIDSGYQLPVYMTTVDRTGLMRHGRWRTTPDGKLEIEPLAEWPHGQQGIGGTYPVNVFFVDARGEAASMTLEPSDKPQRLN